MTFRATNATTAWITDLAASQRGGEDEHERRGDVDEQALEQGPPGAVLGVSVRVHDIPPG
jgi:hypothetical protein